MTGLREDPGIGVIIVTYKAADFIADCLESLLRADYPRLKVVVVDNASPDGTVEAIRDWAKAPAPKLRGDWPFGSAPLRTEPLPVAEYGAEGPSSSELGPLTLIRSAANLGYAGAANLALKALAADPGTDLFWVLNPDTVVEPQTPAAFARKAAQIGRFALIGGRITFFEQPDRIQIDGGRIAPLTAAIGGANCDRPAAATPLPPAESLAFISGASMVASREFVERAGLMDEGYFLYFEEIDWQLRRGDLPLAIAADAVVRHHAGITIGSGGLGKPAPLSVYLSYRNLGRFVARWFPWRLPFAYAFAWVRMLRNLDGTWTQFAAFLAGLHRLPPPAAIRPALGEQEWRRILDGAPAE